MARRDLTTFRTVTQQVVKQPNSLLVAGVQIANQIVEQGQRSKMAESASQAQLEVSALQDQYQIDFQSDPMGGIEKYRNDRQGIYDRHFKGISPLFKRDWQALTRRIGTSNDAVQQAWALRQTRDNTIRSVNTSMQNARLQASNDGRAFGLSDEKEIDFFVNAQAHLENTRRSAEGLLGEEDLNELTGTFIQDYAKSVISGVSETNPIKALQLLESDLIEESFNSPEERSRMTKAVNARALQFGKIKTETEVLNVLSDANSLLTRSAQGEQMGYAELLAVLEGKSPAVRDFFMRANGYSTKGTKGVKLSDSEKQQFRVNVYAELSRVGRKDNPTSEEMDNVQNLIYQGLNNDSLTKGEGVSFTNDWLEPMIEKRKETLKNYTTGGWINPLTGFGKMDEVLERINIPPPIEKEGIFFDTEGELGPLSTLFNNQNTDDLNRFFWSALQSEAQNRGISIGGLQDLGRSEREKVYMKTQRKAVSDLLQKRTGNRPPESATFTDIVSSLVNVSFAALKQASQQVVDDAYVTRPVLDTRKLSVKTRPVSTDVGGLSDAELLKLLQ